MIKIKYYRWFLATLLVCSTAVCKDAITVDTLYSVPDVLRKQLSGYIVGKYKFIDKTGLHILVLTRESKSDNEKEMITLKANQFLLNNNTPNLEWTIKDFVECEGLDISGYFYDKLTSFSDIDNNGIFETTVCYSLICTGDISPKTTKAIMRQGNNKYAVRGESIVKIDNKNILGGTYNSDKTLDSLPKIRDFLISLWKKAAELN